MKFSISQLLWITSIFALMTAFAQLIGVEAVVSCVTLVCVASPSLAFVAACIPERLRSRNRYLFACGVLLIVFSVILLLVFCTQKRSHVMPIVFAIVCSWILQAILFAFLFRMWRSGQQSARRAEQSPNSVRPSGCTGFMSRLLALVAITERFCAALKDLAAQEAW